MFLLIGLSVVLLLGNKFVARSTITSTTAKASESTDNKIMFAGDSITYGVYEPRGGYRYFIEQKMLADSCINYKFVGQFSENSSGMIQKNYYAISGMRTALDWDNPVSPSDHGWLNDLRSLKLVQSYGVDTLVLMLGVPDVAMQKPMASPYNVMESLKEAYAQNPNLKVVLMTNTPLKYTDSAYSDADFRAMQERLNREEQYIVSMYRNLGKNITLVDTFSGFFDSNGNLRTNLFDGNAHPNSAGYQVIANALYSTLGKCLGVSQITPPPVPNYKCDNSYGVCGCTGIGCANPLGAGSNTDWRCCHRECINYACRTVFGENMPNSCDPPDGSTCGR